MMVIMLTYNIKLFSKWTVYWCDFNSFIYCFMKVIRPIAI